MNIFLKSFVLLLCTSISATAIGEEKKGEPKTDADAAKTVKKKKKKKKEEKKDAKKWKVGARSNLYVGQGTFVSLSQDSELNDQLVDTPGDASNFADDVTLSFGANASYTLDPITFGLSVDGRKDLAQIGVDADLVSFGASLNYRLEPMTFGLSMKASQKLSEVGRQEDLIIEDLFATTSWDGYMIEAIGSKVTSGLTLRFPTSFGSRVLNLVVGTSANVGISKTFFKKLNLGFTVTGGKGFHSNVSPSIDPEDVGTENIVFRTDETEFLDNGNVLLGGLTTEYSLGLRWSAGFPIVEKLRMSVGYTLSNNWSYDRDIDTDDEFAPNLVDENGNQIADFGRRFGQSTFGNVSLSYPFEFKGVGLSSSVGLTTRQLPKTADNKSFNFPFWNFNGAAKNQSGINFNLSASY